MKKIESGEINQRYSKCTWVTSFFDDNDSEPQNVNSTANEQQSENKKMIETGRKKKKKKKPFACIPYKATQHYMSSLMQSS